MPTEAAPLMCAGVTTFNALRHGGAGPGDLGRRPGDRRPGPPRACSSRRKFGYRVAAVGRGAQNQALAKRARRATTTSTAPRPNRRTSCRSSAARCAILATAAEREGDVARLIPGLGPNGARWSSGRSAELIEVRARFADRGAQAGDPGLGLGDPADSRGHAGVRRSATGVRPKNERYPLARAAEEAYDRMMSGQARVPGRPRDLTRRPARTTRLRRAT